MSEIDDFIPSIDEPVVPTEGIEFFECQKCSEYNIIKSKPRSRRTTRIRHVRFDNVAWASLKRYAAINNVSLNYALILLLMNARTSKINYIVNERQLVDNTSLKKKNKKN